jgi:ribosome maturation protein Sdo1
MENGDLQVIVSVPAGIVIDFYDKLNAVTHGSALTAEVKEDE